MQFSHTTLIKSIISCSITVLILLSLNASAQNSTRLDSILSAISKNKSDTLNSKLYIRLSTEYFNLKNDTCYYYAKEALRLAKSSQAVKYLGAAYDWLTGLYLLNLRFNDAYKVITEVEQLANEKKDTTLILSALYCRGKLYRGLDQMDKFVETEIKRTEIFHAQKDITNEAISYYVSGWALYNLKEYKPALINLHKAKALTISLKDSLTLQKTYNWIGASHNGLMQFDSALYYAGETMKINKAQGKPYFLGESHRYTGDIYFKKKDFKTALAHYDTSIYKFTQAKAFDRAYLLRTYRAKTLDSLGRIKDVENELNFIFANKNQFNEPLAYKYAYALGKKIYALTGNWKMAIYCYNSNDSLIESRKTDEVEKRILVAEFKKEQEKSDELNKAKEKEREAKYTLETERQGNFLKLFMVGFILVAVIALLIFRNLKRNKKTNLIITAQKEELEEKQKEILDSINYAKRIQYTLLAHEEFLKENLPEHFTYFHPKDIVSGDFYWATSTGSANNKKFYLAVCDSTGHGVPGAFMSLLNIGFLNEAINEKGIEKPNEIFDYVRLKLTNTISKEGQKDGFDGILVCFETLPSPRGNQDGSMIQPEQNTTSSKGPGVRSKITYAAANNAPVLIKTALRQVQGPVTEPVEASVLIELESNRMPVGVGERKENFTLHTIDAKPGDMLYLYTDGYADQFGGPKGKKFKYKQLNELLISLHTKPLNEQQSELKSAFETWKGNLEQVDDVCVIGIRL